MHRPTSDATPDPAAPGANEPPRVIRLRRPPRIIVAAGRFVPEGIALGEVDARWSRLVAANPRYFDGDILHVFGAHRDGHGGVTLHAARTSYRFYAVQRPSDGVDRPIACGVRPLGVKAMASWQGRFLMARRSTSVAYYPGEWEFVPAGGLEPDEDPLACVSRELHEETDFVAAGPAVAVALLYDPGAFSWEIVHRLAVRPAATANERGPSHAWEHADRQLAEPGRWPEPLAAVARSMIGL